jgi:ElaB/YqjD/DUF883 family membrane-anchored ribosome-binding protein
MSLFSRRARVAANCATDSAAYAAKSAGQDFRRARTDAEDTVRDLRKNLNRTAHQTEHKVHRFVDSVRDDIENTRDQITHTIRSNPVQSFLVLLTVGVVLGSLMTSKRS